MSEEKEILARIEAAIKELEKAAELALGNIEPEKGKVHWPIKEGQMPTPNDAYKTLFSLSDATLELSFFDEEGERITSELWVSLMDIYLTVADGGPTYYFRKSLKTMLEEEYQIYADENSTHYKNAQLLQRLIKAFDEPS